LRGAVNVSVGERFYFRKALRFAEQEPILKKSIFTIVIDAGKFAAPSLRGRWLLASPLSQNQ